MNICIDRNVKMCLLQFCSAFCSSNMLMTEINYGALIRFTIAFCHSIGFKYNLYTYLHVFAITVGQINRNINFYHSRKYIPIRYLSIKILIEQVGYAVSLGK